MSVGPARSLAHEVLERVRVRDAFAPQVLDAEIRRSSLDERDAALATRLVYGTLQMLGSVDHAIDHWSTDPASVRPEVRDVLRVAAWEILFGSGSPHAAVNEAVEAVKSAAPRAAGFANAVLRRIAGAADTFPWDDTLSRSQQLALLHGHPRWLVERWLGELGEAATLDVLDADNSPAGLTLMANPFKADPAETLRSLQEDGAEPSWCALPRCIRAGAPSLAIRSAALRGGLAVVTDAAAQLAAVVADPAPGSSVLEIGAGRGTKQLGLQAAASAGGGRAEVYALDVYPEKTRMAVERLKDLGVPGITGLVGDGRRLEEVEGLPGAFDVVLIDAPCSGLGTLRRHPMKRWRTSPEEVVRLALLQAELLSEAAKVVVPGGAIVYATCTISRAENEDVVSGFLDSPEGRGYRVAHLGEWVPDDWKHWLTSDGAFQSLPTAGGPDGHFVARLENRNE